MGQVAALIEFLPEDDSFNFEKLKQELPSIVPEGVKMARADVMPFAFGLMKMEASFIMNDADGLMEKLETRLREIPGIQGIETKEVGLI
jgi:elongation factor 1-beta